MSRRPPRSTRTYTLFPDTPLFRSFLKDHVEHRLPRRHRQRIAAIGRAVGAEHHAARRLFGREARAQRKAAADAFRARHDVGAKTILFMRSEEHTSELQSLMRISYAVFCLKKKTSTTSHDSNS